MFVFRPLILSVIPLLCQQDLKCAFSTFHVDFSKWPRQTLRIYVFLVRPAALVSNDPKRTGNGNLVAHSPERRTVKLFHRRECDGSWEAEGGKTYTMSKNRITVKRWDNVADSNSLLLLATALSMSLALQSGGKVFLMSGNCLVL